MLTKKQHACLFFSLTAHESNSIPKDTVDEHIEALSDETWVMQHFVLQIAYILIFVVTAIPLFKEKRGSEGSEKASYKFIDKDFVRGGIPHPNPDNSQAKKTAKAA